MAFMIAERCRPNACFYNAWLDKFCLCGTEILFFFFFAFGCLLILNVNGIVWSSAEPQRA